MTVGRLRGSPARSTALPCNSGVRAQEEGVGWDIQPTITVGKGVSGHHVRNTSRHLASEMWLASFGVIRCGDRWLVPNNEQNKCERGSWRS